MPHKLTIIIPIYNEAENMQRLRQALLKYLDLAEFPTSILFVNDGSTDNSQNIISDICNVHSAFKSLTLPNNQGLSAALKVGFDAVDTTLVGYMDADLQTHPKDFNHLLQYINEFDLVTGVRTHRQDSRMKKLSSKVANTVRRWFTQDGMDDTGCPLKIIKTDYAKRIPMFKGMHRFLPALVQLQDGKTKQIPIAHYERIAGESKYTMGNRFFSGLVDCFVLLWMKKRYIKPYKIEN